MHKKSTGKQCYNHLGGELGILLFEFYIANEWIERKEAKHTVYVVCEKKKYQISRNGDIHKREYTLVIK